MTYEKTWDVGIDIRLCHGVLDWRIMAGLDLDQIFKTKLKVTWALFGGPFTYYLRLKGE
jgi:hypothetical protein